MIFQKKNVKNNCAFSYFPNTKLYKNYNNDKYCCYISSAVRSDKSFALNKLALVTDGILYANYCCDKNN